jgi:hypothetical protein
MIDLPLRYQITLFGAVEDITASAANIKYFIEAFEDKGLIPVSIQPLGPVGFYPLSLKSSDDSFTVNFSGGRIDILRINQNIGVATMPGLSEFITECKGAITKINSRFPKQFNRLSLVTQILFKELNSDQLNQVFKRVFNPIDFYEQNIPTDWKNRITTKAPLEMETSEQCNVISEVSRLRGDLRVNSKVEKIDRAQLFFDINTFQGNRDYRFGIESVFRFLDAAVLLQKKLEDSYSNHLSLK